MSQHIDPPATQTGLEGLASTVSTLSSNLTLSDATATMLNCTATSTTDVLDVVKILNGELLYIHIRKRGAITAVGSSPAYAYIKISGIDSTLDQYGTTNAVITLREYGSSAFETQPYSGLWTKDSNGYRIQFQAVGGLSSVQWKTTNAYYIDVNILLIKQNS